MSPFHFKKSLGQNFLKNDKICDKIVNLVDIKDKNVIEIGCGNGILTEKILDLNPQKLIVIEIDERCIELTKKRLGDHPNIGKLEFINQDAMNLKIRDLKFDINPIIISNLPYSVGTRIFINLIAQSDKIDQMILMFQKEVAKRIVAIRNTSDYGILSVISQIYGDVKIKFDVEPGNFYPTPEVTSSVITFSPKQITNILDFDLILNTTKQLFSQRRKMIRSYCKNFPIDLLEKYGKYRAQELTIDETLFIVNQVKIMAE